MMIRRAYYFFPVKEKGFENDGRLKMRISFDKKRFHYSLGYRVKFNKWNRETQLCLINSSHGEYKIHASTINTEIIELTKLGDDVFNYFELNKTIPSLKEFREKFYEFNNTRLGVDKSKNQVKVKPVAFFDVMDKFIKEEGRQNNWTDSTYEKFGTVKNHLLRFDNKLKFEDLNHAKLNDYKSYLSTERDLRDITIDKQLKNLKWFLNWATRNGCNKINDYTSYKPKLRKADTKVIFLSVEEVVHLENMEIPDSKEYLDRVRDVFLFQCFTGLRYSDVKNLKHWDIKKNHISLTTQKTTDTLKINLINQSKKILDKYKDIPFENEMALPVISNQKMNLYLKELCELAGFDEMIEKVYFKGGVRYSEVRPKYKWISTHTGRRSFISNALASGMPPNIVMDFTGHSDYQAMKPYIDAVESAREKHMEHFSGVFKV